MDEEKKGMDEKGVFNRKSYLSEFNNETNALSRLDSLEWSSWHSNIMFILGTGWLMDSFEATISSSSLPYISKTFNLPEGGVERAYISSVWTFGGVFGSILFGYLADACGRKKTFLITIAMYSVFTAITAFSPSFVFFLIMRALTSIGVAAEYSAVTSCLAEFVPLKYRGQSTTLVLGLWSVGGVIASGVNSLILPFLPYNIGWRVSFSFGGLAALFLIYARKSLPESPRYLIARGDLRKAEAIVSSIALKCKQEEHGKDLPAIRYPFAQRKNFFKQLILLFYNHPFQTIFACTLDAAQSFGAYGITSLLTVNILPLTNIPEAHYPLFFMVGFGFAIPGTVVVALLIDKIGRKVMLPLGYFLAGTSLFFIYPATISGSNFNLYAAFAFFNFSYTTAWNSAYPVYTELFPTRFRSTGIGFAVAIGRLAGIFSPILLSVIFNMGDGKNFLSVILVSAASFYLTCLACIPFAIYGQDGKGKSLEESVGE